MVESWQPAVDAVHASHAGRPVDEVRQELATELRRREICLPGKTVDRLAQLISEAPRAA